MQQTRSNTRAEDALDVAVNQVGIGSGIDTGGTGSHLLGPARRPVWSTPQVHAYPEVIVAVFLTPEAAEAGLERVKATGINVGQCGVVVRSGPVTLTRGLLARGGCVDDGPFAALRQWGVPDETARLYQQTFEAGQTVLAVRSIGRADRDRAFSTLQQIVGTGTRQDLVDARPLERQATDRPSARRRSGHRRSRAATARTTR